MDKKLLDIQNQIENTKKELEEIKKLEKPLPEFINSTNVLRSNEYYTKEIEKQSELLTHYETYSKGLENLVLSAINLRTKISELKIRSKSKRKIAKKPVKRRKKPVKKRVKSKKRPRKSKPKPRRKRR